MSLAFGNLNTSLGARRFAPRAQFGMICFRRHLFYQVFRVSAVLRLSLSMPTSPLGQAKRAFVLLGQGRQGTLPWCVLWWPQEAPKSIFCF